jgi:ornithine decarboxylase
MVLQQAFLNDPAKWLSREQPDEPVYFFDPKTLRATARQFLDGFPGEVTYAVKANPAPAVLETLVEAGIAAFDVASPQEMEMVRRASPAARLHYHNPVRSKSEITAGRSFGALSWSVDRLSELDKIGDLRGLEIAVRLKLPVSGAAYDFGSKFGATPEDVAQLLRVVQARGGLPSITFHPGTQCEDPQAWSAYIFAAADVARQTGIPLHRLNVGGGFPAHRNGTAPALTAIFDAIRSAAELAFDGTPPPLVCEPGRAMVSESYELALQVKAVIGETVFLNDGVYGGLSEWRDIAPADRIRVFSHDGQEREGATFPATVFGPTCDSIDKLPDAVALPKDLQEGDHLLFHACGAYSAALATRFNGYGARRVVTLLR